MVYKTSIQIESSTLNLLKSKKKFSRETYNEIIIRLCGDDLNVT